MALGLSFRVLSAWIVKIVDFIRTLVKRLALPSTTAEDASADG